MCVFLHYNWLGGYTIMSADNEQWLTNGICEKCRKQKYCSKPCTRNKRRTSAILRSATIQAMDAYSGGVYSSVLKALDEVSKFS